jgi:hypothetical protein
MDVRKALSELYLERQQLEEAIISLEHLVKLSCKRRGLQSSWMRSRPGRPVEEASGPAVEGSAAVQVPRLPPHPRRPPKTGKAGDDSQNYIAARRCHRKKGA